MVFSGVFINLCFKQRAALYELVLRQRSNQPHDQSHAQAAEAQKSHAD